MHKYIGYVSASESPVLKKRGFLGGGGGFFSTGREALGSVGNGLGLG